MSATEMFGIVAVTSMVTAYALESRGAVYVLIFAMSCLAAATYAVLIRSWPFAAVEAIWSVVAFRRWLERRSGRRGV